MSEAFKGFGVIQELAKDMPNVSIGSVSCEPTSYRDGEFPIDRGFWEHELIRLFDAYAPVRDNGWREYGVDFENDVFRVRYDRQDGDCSCGFSDLAEKWHADNPHLPACYSIVLHEAIAKWELEHGMDAAEEASHCDIFTVASDLEFKDGFPNFVNPIKFTRYEDAMAHLHSRGGMFSSTSSPRAAAAHKSWCSLYDAQRKWEASLTRRLCREMGIPWNDGRGSACHCTCGKDQRAKAWFANHDHKEPCDIWWMGQPNFLHKPSGYGVHWYKYPCRDAYGTQPMSPAGFVEIIGSCIASI